MILILYLLKAVIFAVGLVCIGLYFERKDRLEHEKKMQRRQPDPRVLNTPIDPQ